MESDAINRIETSSFSFMINVFSSFKDLSLSFTKVYNFSIQNRTSLLFAAFNLHEKTIYTVHFFSGAYSAC